METVMHEIDEFDFLRFEQRPLTPEQRDHRKQRVIRRAKIARVQARRRLFASIATSLRATAVGGRDMVRALGHRASAALSDQWTAYENWRESRRAVAELTGLDDRLLKDLGLHRSEIESVVYGHESKQITEGKIATALFHKPYSRPRHGGNPATKQLFEKSAA
jgi:uncharacterized protein YjiS (DUF1127 family)